MSFTWNRNTECVKSSPGNFRNRIAIRKSWGNSASSHRNRLIFSLGSTLDLTHQIHVDREMEQYEDILQGTFQDTYKNLTLKTINSIQWTSRYCSSANFVLFVDDDVIVNFKNLENFLWQLPLIEREQLITGYVITEYPSPNRFETKFALSLDEYRHPCYPPYISDPVVVTSGKMVKLFADAIPYVKPFVFEDVYLGIIVSKLGIKLSPVHNHLFDPSGSGVYNWSLIISSHQGKSMVFEAIKMIVSDLHFVTNKTITN
ncbi:hypothetical protein FSP39_006086 [Pinctada imbricata]|uniref:Hexosyltransferase n=1 Tax=Pinctada imbricata TaxID=66713 RepID=A0AA88XER9_PINIB|nr:hypothetical protein FSP39_006086 [Pinctada imbricata]